MFANASGQTGSAATSLTAVFKGSVASGDWIGICIGSDGYNAFPTATTAISASWTKTTELTGTSVGAVCYWRSAAGGETSIAVTGLTSNEYTWHTVVIPGYASVGTAIATASGGNFNNRTSTGITTTSALTLNLAMIVHDGARFTHLKSPAMFINRVDGYAGSNSPQFGSQIMYQFEPATSTATGGIEYGISAAVGSGVLEIPIVMNAANVPPYILEVPGTLVHVMNASTYASEYGGASDLEAATIGTVDGHTTTGNCSVEGGNASPSGFNGGARIRQTGGTNQNTLVSYTHQITEGDYSGGKVLSFNMRLDLFAAFASYAEGSVYIGFRSDEAGASNGPYRRIWKMPSAGASPDGGDLINICIDPENTDYVYDSGTGSAFEPAKIDGVVLMAYRNITEVRYDVSFLRELGTLKMAGGSTNDPLTFDSFADAMLGYESLAFRKNAEGQYSHEINIQIGNGGTNATYFSQSGANVKGPTQNNEASALIQYRAATMPTVKLDIGASDTLTLTDSLLGGGTEGGIDFDFASGATVELRGTIANMKAPTFTAVNSGDLANLTFRACDTIPEGSDLANVTIDQTTSTNAALELSDSAEAGLATDLSTVGAVALTNNTTGPALRLVNTGASDTSMELTSPSNMTWSGNTTDVHLEAANETDLTFNMGSGGNASTTDTSGDAGNSVTISNDVTLTLTIQDESGSAVSAAEVVVLNRGTQTEIDHDNNTASGTYAYTYTYSSDTTIDIQVLREGYIPFWDDTQSLLSTSQTFTVTLIAVPASQN